MRGIVDEKFGGVKCGALSLKFGVEFWGLNVWRGKISLKFGVRGVGSG